MIRFIKFFNNKNWLCSTKKQYDKGRLKVYKEKLDQSIGGHLIYQTQKSKNFMLVGIGILCGLGFSVTVYRIQSNWTNFFPLLICIASTIFYQKRLFNTVRKIIIQKSGQDMRIQRYGLLGSEFMSGTLIAPIYLMRGVSKKTINRGVVMQGGGKYGYESFKYYFQSDGVKDKIVFDAVLSGTCIKYVDKF